LFASSEASVAARVARAFADTARRRSARVGAVGEAIAPYKVRSQQFAGPADGKLRVLLDGIAETYLWLRLDFDVPAGAGTVSLDGLRIRYPDRSWMDELPAIYREDPPSAVQLRQFLAPFEALYGDIDEAIDGLPGLIDPATAPAAQLPELLSWLGFPPTAGLDPQIQRDLLRQAGSLLMERGTRGALERMLAIVTSAPASVEDASASAPFWIVAGAPRRTSARLGRDTKIVSGLAGAGFAPGRARLGEAWFPPRCTDVDGVLRDTCARLVIRVTVAPERHEIVKPILEALLAMFVPAHCRVDLRVAARAVPAGLDAGLHLAAGHGSNDQARLAAPIGARLGELSRAGAWRLPRPEPPPFTVDGRTPLDGDRWLA
jgi:phage tail-like protein